MQPLPLLRGNITYSFAKREEVNILQKLRYPEQRAQFFQHIASKHNWIKSIVVHHLNLRASSSCHVADVGDWLHGSFNVCIPITIDHWPEREQPGRRVLIRFPLPYRVGDSFRPGNGDEKIRCEAATYAWIQANCPDVPIPRLYGFATSTGEAFTRLNNLPFLARCFQHIRHRLLSWFCQLVPSQYVRHQCRSHFSEDRVSDAGYMLIECIEDVQGEMLSNTWAEKQHEAELRSNLFHDLARIFLSITRTPLPKIGSFVIDHDGFLSLTNRPLSIELQDLENEQIPTDIPRDYTYDSVNTYVMDILACHDSRIRNQPNAINHASDYLYQTGALTAMRTIFPFLFTRCSRHGPFVLHFTDLHQSNIFVNKAWRITALVDLEWVCALPISFFHFPTCFSNKAVDELAEEAEEYDAMRREFIDILVDEEQKLGCLSMSKRPRLSASLKESWGSGIFWYALALASPTGLFAIFYKKIKPTFREHTSTEEEDPFAMVMPWFWAGDFVQLGQRKLLDKEAYDQQLREVFENGSEQRKADASIGLISKVM